MKKILIIQQPVANRGDESAHRGLMHQLVRNFPDCQFTVLFYDRLMSDVMAFAVEHPHISYQVVMPEYSREFRYRLIRWYAQGKLPLFMLRFLPGIRKMIPYFKNADYVLGAPGGINLGGFQDWTHLAFFLMAKQLGCTVSYFARSIGPFNEDNPESALFKKRCVELFTSLKALSLRDDESMALSDALSLNAIPTIDSAFLRDEISCEWTADIAEGIGDKPYLVFVPNCLVWHYKYKPLSYEEVRAFWAELLHDLLAKYPDSNIIMLPQTTGHCPVVPDGYIYFNQIKDLLPDSSRVYVLPEQYGSDIQQSIIAKADLLIGARYHSIVFAVNQGVPFVSLTYEHKMSGLLSMVGLSDMQIDIESAFLSPDKDYTGLKNRILARCESSQVPDNSMAKNKALGGFKQFFAKLFS